MSKSQNHQISAANFLYRGFQIFVAGLALSAGANARSLTSMAGRNNQQYPLPHYTGAAIRGGCKAQLAAVTDQNLGKQMYAERHVTLTGCRKTVAENETCTQPIGTSKDGSILLREPHKKGIDKQGDKIKRNARTIYDVLSCEKTIKDIKNALKQEGFDIKKNPEVYKERLSAEIVKIITERQIKMDGVSLIFEDGVAGQEKCMSISTLRKGFNSPRVAIVLNPDTCKVKGIHPMITGIPCGDLCGESKRLEEKHTTYSGTGGR